MNKPDRRFTVAPMMDWTDRHCRAFHRTLTQQSLLYSEMVTAEAILRGIRQKLLGRTDAEGRVALQLGGSNPAKLAEAARIGEEWGYCEINLNVGCPSDRVQEGSFGACLMKEPQLVADCYAAMADAVRVPVTIKNRIGVDDQDPQEALFNFVDTVAAAGCKLFIVHARKAMLSGLSPKENRDIPPLDYPLVESLKQSRPGLSIILNGGLSSLAHIDTVMGWADGVMLGRAAYHDPGLLGFVDKHLYAAHEVVTPDMALDAYEPYIAAELAAGTPLFAITRHMLGLYQGRRGARTFRRIMSEDARQTGAGLEILRRARAAVAPEQVTL